MEIHVSTFYTNSWKLKTNLKAAKRLIICGDVNTINSWLLIRSNGDQKVVGGHTEDAGWGKSPVVRS